MIEVSKLVALVKATAAAFIPGLPAAEKAAEKVLQYVKSMSATLSEQDQKKLQAALPDLLTAMNLDVDQAIADLRGEA